ncbi:uncharacterized protein [Macrobrachium rosenbergii]|uniref:uncharacterized protein n=1 Tax=Macrobrachium rosenbergii TaxID=79674 RepID=UPI0034D5C482
MKTSLILMMAVAGIWCLPTNVEKPDDHNRKQATVVVKDRSDVEIKIEETDTGKYKLEAYQGTGSERSQIPAKAWKVPNDWKAPGRNTSKVVHAELLSNGDLVLVLYSRRTGLELIVLPLEILEIPEQVATVSPRPILFPGQPIIFPNATVPWHPTLPTPPEKWEWVPSDVEVVTPSAQVYPVPERSSLPSY